MPLPFPVSLNAVYMAEAALMQHPLGPGEPDGCCAAGAGWCEPSPSVARAGAMHFSGRRVSLETATGLWPSPLRWGRFGDVLGWVPRGALSRPSITSLVVGGFGLHFVGWVIPVCPRAELGLV